MVVFFLMFWTVLLAMCGAANTTVHLDAGHVRSMLQSFLLGCLKYLMADFLELIVQCSHSQGFEKAMARDLLMRAFQSPLTPQQLQV